jgi:hypothetical protein
VKLQRLPALIFSLLAVCAVGLAAEDQAAVPDRSCIVYPVLDLSSGSAAADYSQPITDTIGAAIEVNGWKVLPPDPWLAEAEKKNLHPRALLDMGPGISVARDAGADMAVSGSYVVKDQEVFISLQCWDVKAGRLAAGIQEKARFNLAFYSYLHDRVARMLQRVVLSTPAEAAATAGAAPGIQLPQVTFLSPDEGMEVILSGDRSIGTVSGGKLVWIPGAISQGQAILVEKRKAGYHTAWQNVRVGEEVKLSGLARENRNGQEVDWTWGQLAGLGTTYRYYLAPDELFLAAGTYLFVQPPLTSAGTPIYHVDVNIGVGGYLFLPPDFPVRLGISSGAGVVTTFPGNPVLPPGADFYLTVINWWLETRILGPVVFLRQEWKFALGLGTNYLGTQWIMPASFPPLTLGVMFQW